MWLVSSYIRVFSFANINQCEVIHFSSSFNLFIRHVPLSLSLVLLSAESYIHVFFTVAFLNYLPQILLKQILRTWPWFNGDEVKWNDESTMLFLVCFDPTDWTTFFKKSDGHRLHPQDLFLLAVPKVSAAIGKQKRRRSIQVCCSICFESFSKIPPNH